MSSLEIAYCTEIDDYLAAEEAYEFYWAGKIRNKKGFECPNEICNASVSCANIDKDKIDMVQIPHFRSYNHIKGCKFGSLKNEYPLNSSIDIKDPYSHLNGNEKIELLTERPADYFDEILVKNKILKSEKNKNTLNDEKKERAYKRRYRYFSIGPLVSKFIRFKKSAECDKNFLTINNFEISFQDLFKGVYNQEYNKLSEKIHIYWGVATISRTISNDSFRFKFYNSMLYNSKKIHPSIIIPDNILELYPMKHIENRIKKAFNNDDKRVFIFIYGKPTLNDKNGITYINFQTTNLDHIEIRYLDLFEDLKKNKTV